MLPLQYGVLIFAIFSMHFPEESEECLSTADCYTNLTCVGGKCFRKTEGTTEKPAKTEAGRSKHITALQFFDVF
jgi:hypothetical protein